MLSGSPLSQRRKLAGFLFALPALCFFLVFFLYPVLVALVTSFSKWDLRNPREFVGVSNYVGLLSDRKFLHSLALTIYFVFADGVLTLSVALALALIVDRDLAFSGVFKAAFFFPSILSLTVVAILFRFLSTPYGLITLVGEALTGVAIPWQSSFTLAMPLIIMMMVWNRIGFYMIIFVAGLRLMPSELYDAFKVDGASYWVTLRRLIVPLMVPVFLLTAILKMTENFRHFAPFYLLTEGGPGDATTVLTLRIYRDGMESFRMGKASAESMIVVSIMLLCTFAYLRLLGRETEF